MADAADLDDLDRRIVGALRADGRLSMRTLAERLHISRASAYSRVDRLQRDGVITGYAASIDPQRYGYGVSAYIYLRISQHSWHTVGVEITAIPEVEHAALVTGDSDIVLLVRARDTAALRELVLDRLQAMPQVLGTQTVLIFEELRAGNPASTQPARR